MELVTFTLVLLVAFSGVIVGYLLSLIAPEELLPFQKYFTILAYGLSSLVILFLLQGLGLHWILSGGVALIVFAAQFRYLFTPYLYALFGGVLAFTRTLETLFWLEASLIFILGFPLATIKAVPFIKKNAMTQKGKVFIAILRTYGWIVPVGLVVYLI